MDIKRLQQLAGIISESADVTDKIKKGTLKTDAETEAIDNKIVQGENGDVQVADDVKPVKKKIGLKEEFNAMLQRAGGGFGRPVPERQAAMAPYYAAFHKWKQDCRARDPKCAFQGTKTGTEAVNYEGARPRMVGQWDKATAKGQVF